MSGKPNKKQKVTGPPAGGGGGKPKKGTGKPKTVPKAALAKGYEWQSFTTKSVNFVAAARELSDYVERTYGTNVSITHYEKFLVAFSHMKLEERSKLCVEQDGVKLAQKYQAAKDARDSERQSFRGDIQVADVQGTLASLAASFSEPEGSKRPHVEGAEGDEDDQSMG
jgi:hypothetical protein